MLTADLVQDARSRLLARIAPGDRRPPGMLLHGFLLEALARRQQP
ncbi:MAG: hypothetical protein ACREMB_23770 [Candidatus Rokuibacteriota bacterium]